jgi:hypothetical protein
MVILYPDEREKRALIFSQFQINHEHILILFIANCYFFLISK